MDSEANERIKSLRPRKRKTQFVSKKPRRIVEDDDGDGGEDRISGLPDELIHYIFSFVDAKFAVQSSLLSNRWKNVWKTLPHLNLNFENFKSSARFARFVQDFLLHRDRGSSIEAIEYVQAAAISPALVKKILKYALSHNAKHFLLKTGGTTYSCNFPISLFDSPCLKKLTVGADLMLTNSAPDAPWGLPALTELEINYADIPPCSWKFPALTNLYLYGIHFTKDNIVRFSDIVNLKSISLCNCTFDLETVDICSEKLNDMVICNDNLNTIEENRCFRTCNFVVTAPRLREFAFMGFYPIIMSAPHGLDSMDYVIINYMKCSYMDNLRTIQKYESELIAQKLLDMFKALRHTRHLRLSSYTVKALSNVPDLLENQGSPFNNLETLKLEKKSFSSIIPIHVKSYLLSGFEEATNSSPEYFGPWKERTAETKGTGLKEDELDPNHCNQFSVGSSSPAGPGTSESGQKIRSKNLAEFIEGRVEAYGSIAQFTEAVARIRMEHLNIGDDGRNGSSAEAESKIRKLMMEDIVRVALTIFKDIRDDPDLRDDFLQALEGSRLALQDRISQEGSTSHVGGEADGNSHN